MSALVKVAQHNFKKYFYLLSDGKNSHSLVGFMELSIPELMCHNTKNPVQNDLISDEKNMYVCIYTPLFSQM